MTLLVRNPIKLRKSERSIWYDRRRSPTNQRQWFNDTHAVYQARWLAKAAWHVFLKHVTLKHDNLYFRYDFRLEFVPCYLPKFTFWQVCSLVVFVPCQNLILASMFVGRVCLLLAKITILASMLVGHVCYLPKFTFWQVCSLVVFVTCQNLHFGKYVGWSCLLLLASMLVGHVCLFVCTEISQNLKNDSVNHHQTWSQASTSPWFLQVRWTEM